MKQRCNNPNDKDYKDYGGRGIKVCERWNDFQNFFADMGSRPPGLTLDRINNDGNYEPGNCRWATRKEQASNTRKQRMFIAMNHEGTMIASNNQSEFAKKHGLNLGSVSNCLNKKRGRKITKGWRFEYAYSGNI
jgi:hypothetical protein